MNAAPSFGRTRHLLAAIGLALITFAGVARAFVHPGGLHTQADLDRMKTQVAAGAHPWIDGWNQLITDSKAQNTYTAAPQANMGVSRQRADADAHAAYLNAIRWYVSGDTSYADCAVRILNGWSAAVNQVPTGTDIPGLSGIPIMDFALAAEVLRIYPGWAAADQTRFQTMMTTYLYPVCHDFLTNHNGACITHYWANWDICNLGAMIAMGVFCDNQAIYNEGVTYFQSGAGNGNIMNTVYYLHPGGLGQWQESGRDQSHAQLGIGMLGYACQVAWNQGLDLFGYSSNRLLAGSEYVAQTGLLAGSVPYVTYNNCDNVNQYYVAHGGGFGDRPVYELLYNHYVVRKGLSAPNIKAMAQVMRPEWGSIDHFGYGTLTFTLNAAASPYPASPVSPPPTDLIATPGIGHVSLNWGPASSYAAQGYNVLRATASGGPYTSIASWAGSTWPGYTDNSVTNGTTYYYVVATNNQSGTSANSAEVTATPVASGALPAAWTDQDIGSPTVAGSAGYASVANNSYVVVGEGAGIGGTSDSFHYAYETVTGDFTLTARLWSLGGVQAGVMMRESVDPAAPALMMKVGDLGWREAGFGTRSTTAGVMTWVGGNAYSSRPVWFRLQRSGDTFTASQSYDSATWFTVGTSTVAMASTYLVGLAVTSGSTTGALNTSVFDNVSDGVVPPPAPAAPGGLTATAVSSSQINLAWTNNATNQSGFKVERSADTVLYYEIANLGAGATSFANTGLPSSTTYSYRVRAYNIGGYSAYSATASAATQAPTIPAAPTGLTAAAANTQVTLNWSASGGATSYNVKRATVSGGPYTTVGTTGYFTTFTDTGLTNGTTYYYVVSAVNVAGESVNSSQASATPTDFVGYWKFDETSGTIAYDSANTNNGTLSATGAAWGPGKIGGAVVLTGASSGYVSLPIGSVVGSLGDFTIAGWANLSTNSAWARFFDFGSNTTKYMFLAPQSGSNTIRFAITTGGGGGEQQINGTAIPSTGVWHHFAVTVAGAVGTLYVDGVAVGSNSNMTLHPSSLGSTPNNYIGKSQFNDPYLNGSVDDFRIYARALSATEISSIMNPSVNPPSVPTGLTATPGDAQVALNWTASTGATSYNVKRATVTGGPYTTVASPTTTSYTDTTAANGTTYYYVVSAVNSGGESANSTQAGATPVPALQASLRAYLKFDEASGTTASDSSGNGWNGTLVGGPTWVTGHLGNAVSLSGSNQYVSFATGVVSTLNDFTIAAWVNLNALGTWNRIFDFGIGTPGSTTGAYMFLTPKSGGGAVRFAITTSGYSHEQQINGTAALPTGGWHRVAVTLAGTVGTLYVDGVAVGSNSNMTLHPSNLGSTPNNYIGKSQFNDPYLNGSVDDFRIYNVALTAAQVAALP